MSTLLVTYAIDDPGHVSALEAYLSRFESTQLSPTTCILDADVEAESLFQQLEAQLGVDDRVYVFTLSKEWIGYGYEAVNDWLHRHVGPGPSRKKSQ